MPRHRHRVNSIQLKAPLSNSMHSQPSMHQASTLECSYDPACISTALSLADCDDSLFSIPKRQFKFNNAIPTLESQ